MDAKFTRGPWRVRKDENGNTVVATMPEPSDILPRATQSWHLAIVMGTPGKRDKQANANIMAASPLLYEALDRWSGKNHSLDRAASVLVAETWNTRGTDIHASLATPSVLREVRNEH